MSSVSDPSSRRERYPPPRLVLVEDDENVRRSMTMLLRARGFQIDAYRTGSELLMMQGRHGGHCLLIDYKMPRLDGLELMRRLRAQHDSTPGIMITGYYSDTLRAKAVSAGFADVLEKPTRAESLVDMIERTVL